MNAAATYGWFARHELRLAWRDWLSMMTAGQRWRLRYLVLTLIAFAVFMHLVAAAMVGRFAIVGESDHDALVIITSMAFLSWCLVLSQAMESVTRAFYARSDLDLILSSPVASRRLFAVRLGTVAGSVALMALLIASPFINILALNGGAHWLAAYVVVAALGLAAAAVATALTVAMFRVFGPKRTRLLAQIMAAVIGAAFVIGLQVGAILSYGTLSRLALFETGAISRHAPPGDSLLWLPARAMLGDMPSLAVIVGLGALVLAGSIIMFSRRFGEYAVAASSSSVQARGVTPGVIRPFRRASAASMLRRKEWKLLIRDPWLVSQSLMQILYLLPPALMLWLAYREGSGAMVVVVPVVVMISGQLSGGLAWLAISGEDAPELVATAPVTTAAVIRAKIEAVLGCIAVVLAPFVVALGLFSPIDGVIAALGIVAAATSGAVIQLWFRAQAKRSQFRRRQTSSRIATFAEAFASIAWAGTAALATAGSWFAVLCGLAAIGILLGARTLSPVR